MKKAKLSILLSILLSSHSAIADFEPMIPTKSPLIAPALDIYDEPESDDSDENQPICLCQTIELKNKKGKVIGEIVSCFDENGEEC